MQWSLAALLGRRTPIHTPTGIAPRSSSTGMLAIAATITASGSPDALELIKASRHELAYAPERRRHPFSEMWVCARSRGSRSSDTGKKDAGNDAAELGFVSAPRARKGAVHASVHDKSGRPLQR